LFSLTVGTLDCSGLRFVRAIRRVPIPEIAVLMCRRCGDKDWTRLCSIPVMHAVNDAAAPRVENARFERDVCAIAHAAQQIHAKARHGFG